MNNLYWALTCANRGWLVFPSLGKKPLVKWGTQATTDGEQVRAWFTTWPDADVCIKTGAESGLVVVDWDAYKQEDAADPAFPLTDDGACPLTYTALTPKGGFHFYFTHPGYAVANSAGALAPYVDLRGDGGMVVAYQPAALTATFAPIPPEWATKRTTVTAQVAPVAEPYAGDGDGMTLAVSLLEGYANDVLNAAEGTLNTTLWKRASDAYKMVAAGELSGDAVYNLLKIAAAAAGHPSEGAHQTILSGRNRGMLEPTSCVSMAWKEKGR